MALIQQFLFVVGISMFSIRHADSRLEGPNTAFLGYDPSGPSSKGNEFYIAFIGNNLRNTNLQPTAGLFVTTDEEEPVSFTVEYLGQSQTGSAIRDSTTLVRLPVESGVNDVRVDNNEQRDKGVYLKAEGDKRVTVYGINDVAFSTDAFLALPYHTYGVQEYRYFVFSASIETENMLEFHSRFLLVGNEDDTEVTIIPTRNVDVPSDVTENNFGFTIDWDGLRNTGTIVLNRLETALFQSTEDLTGTIITSNKPLSVFVGHECGQIPTANTACDHLVEQMPPDTTWGTQFFTVPLDLRESGERYRVGTVTDNNRVVVTCTTEEQAPRTLKNETINTARGVNLIQWVEFDTVGDDVDGVTESYRRDFCCIETSKPAVVMMYSKGHSVDEIVIEGANEAQGDPFMLLIPPVSQYANNYTVTSAKSVRTVFNGHISYALPIQFFNNTAADRSAFKVNGSARMPESSNGYHPIYCANREICGYGAYDGLPVGSHVVEYDRPGAAMNLFLYGFFEEISFGYPAGFELQGIGVPRISIFNVTVFENVGSVTVPIRRTAGDLTRNTVIRATTRDSTAVAGQDYTARSNVRVRWQAGEELPRSTDPAFSFEILDDDIPEARQEYFEIELTLTRNGVFYPYAVGRVTILDNDIPPQIGFDPESYTFNENAGVATLTITTSDPTMFTNANGALFYTTDGSAQGSGGQADFTGIAQANAIPIIFEAGQTSTTVTVPITNDNRVEGDEQFFGQIISGGGIPNIEIFAPTATVDIVDDDFPIFGFESSSYSFDESVGIGMVAVTLDADSGQLSENLVFTFSTQDGTAEAPGDYTAVTSMEYTFTPGQMRVVIPVTISDDNVFEGPEAFIGMLATSHAGAIITVPMTTININDNDLINIGFDPVSYTYNEDVGVATLTIRKFTNPAALMDNITVVFSTMDDSAVAAMDYTAVSGFMVTFTPEEESKTVEVMIINDDVFEQDPESFFGNLMISPASDSIAQVTVPQATVNIVDDDESVLVGFYPSEYIVTEGEAAMLRIVLSMSFSEEVTVELQTGDGSATDPGDYTGVITTVTFPAGITERFVSVSTTDDDNSEGLESFTATLSNASPNVVTINQSLATVSIEDNDAVQVSFERPSYTVEEDDGTAEVCITTSTGHPDRAITVTIQPQEGTNANCGDALEAIGDGTDYDGSSLTRTFTASSTSGRLCVNIPISSDRSYEGNEQFLVTFDNLPDVANRVAVGDISQACVLITDENDLPRINITTPDVTVNEPDGPARVCLEISNRIDGDNFPTGIQVTLTTGPKAGATNQATADVDYVASNTLMATFLPSDEALSERCVEIPIIDDQLGNEPNEQFSVKVSTFSPSELQVENDEACVTIIDDDVPEVTWEEREVTIPEGDDMMLCFNSNIGSAVEYEIIVAASGKGSNPAVDADYSIGSPLTFNVPASGSGERFCVDVSVLTDSVDEAVEQFQLTFSNLPSSLATAGDPSSVCINIEDATRPVVSWEFPEVIVTEGNNAQACFVSDIGSAESYDVIVGVRETVANPATRDVDYSLGSLMFTVPASPGGSGSRFCVDITTIQDVIAERTEQFELIFTNLPDSSVDVGTPSTVLVSIRDDDLPVVIIERPNITVPEGDPDVEICVILTTGVPEQVIVTAVTGPKSGTTNPATAGTDYMTTTLMLTFEPSRDGRTVCGNVTIIDDNLGLEPNELFSVRITSVAGSNVMIGEEDESCIEIIDDDVPEIKWEEDRVTIPEGDDRTVCFTSDIGTAAPYSVVVAASPKGGNPAVGGVDYTVESTLSFNVPVMASGGRYCVDLSTVDDNIAEGTEQFQLTFDSITPAGSATEGDPAVLCVDIGDNDDPIINVERPNITVPEGDPDVEICVVLTTGITEQVIVTAVTGPKSGTTNPATAGSDYETTTLMLPFEPSGDGQTVCGRVPIIDDNLGLEPNELFSVRITSVSGANVMIGDQDESCVEIIDDDVPEIKWEEDRVTIPEGDDRTVCFTSDIGTAAAYSVVVAASPKLDNRPATEGDDYTVESTLSFNVPVMASGGRYCIDLSTVDDSIAEGTEQFQLTFDSITPAGSATEGNPAVLCVDIGDNDAPEVNVEVPNTNVTEGEPDVEICIRLTTGITERVIVTAETGPKSGAANPATAGSDYDTTTLMLPFEPSGDGQTVCGRVPITDDSLGLEPNELFSVTITSVTGTKVMIGPDTETCVTIIDNDVPEVKWDDDVEISIPEGDDRRICFSSDIGTASPYDVVVGVRGKGDPPATSDDYTVGSNLAYTIPAMPSGGQFCVDLSIVDDTKDEGVEQLELYFTNLPSESANAGDPASVCVNIEDNDVLTVTFEMPEYTVRESDGMVEVCVLTNIGHTSPVVVEITPVEKVGAQYRAESNVDFDASTQTVTFATSATSDRQCFNVPITSDSLYEYDEQFLVQFGNIPNAQAEAGPIPEACITITDDDEPTFIIDPPKVNVTEPEGEVEICVTTTNLLGREVVVTAVTQPKNGAMFQATADMDYEITTIMYTFQPSDERVCGNVVIIDDMIGNEPDEEFSVRIISASPGGNFDSNDESCVTIMDDDVVGIDFSTMDVVVNENNGTVTVCLTKNITTQGPIMITFDAEEEAGVPNPADGVTDFRPGLGNIVFEGNQREACGQVEIKNDNNPESNEVFMVTFFATNLVIPQPPDRPAPIAEVTIIDDDGADMMTCRITEPQRVQTYSFSSTYGFIDVCEHIATSLCEPVEGYDVRVTVDFLTETMDNGAVGLHVNNFRYVSREDGSFDASVNDSEQTPLSSSTADRLEYDATTPTRVVVERGQGVTNITFFPGNVLDAEISIVHTYEGDNPSIEINVRSSSNATEFCGLCGSRSGQLLRPDGTVANRDDMAEREQFTRSYLVEPRYQILRPQRRECGNIRNDTVIGDPLYAAPVYSEDGREYSLCYEVYGRTNTTLNLVSDTCVNVNARYGPMNNPEEGNIINAIGVRAKGLSDNSCHNIRVDLDGCSANIDRPDGSSVSLASMQSFEQDGISVRKYPRRVRIAAPNCENVMLVMWVICENRNNNDMIKFVIARGVNLRPTSHGLLGQFWNVRASFTKFNGTGLYEGADISRYYVVTVDSASEGGSPRSFLGEFYHLKWDKSRESCLYAGNAQGGPSYEVEDPNDSVIEGRYSEYIISDEDRVFDTQYKYSEFDESRC